MPSKKAKPGKAKTTPPKKSNTAAKTYRVTGGNRQPEVNSSSGSQDTMNAGESPLHELFIYMLQDIHSAEIQLLPALKNMQQLATTSRLKEAIQDHHYLTQKHISRVEKALELLEAELIPKECSVMKALIEEGTSTIQRTPDNSMTRDAAIIIAAQQIEHYEVATYGGLVQIALTMNHLEVSEMLDRTLMEEERTDRLLTHIAENYINLYAEREEDRMVNG
jgi:ferritin-like metal-binding protein YciE